MMMKWATLAVLVTTGQCIKLSPHKAPPQEIRQDLTFKPPPASLKVQTGARQQVHAKKQLLSSWKSVCSFPAKTNNYDVESLWWIADASYAWEGLSCDEMCFALSQEDPAGRTYICDQDYLDPKPHAMSGGNVVPKALNRACVEALVTAARNSHSTCEDTNNPVATGSENAAVPFVSSKQCSSSGADLQSCFSCGWDADGRGAACDARVLSSYRWKKSSVSVPGNESYADVDDTYRRICPCRGIMNSRKQSQKIADERKAARDRIMQSKETVLRNPYAPGGELYNPQSQMHIDPVKLCKGMTARDKGFWVLATGRYLSAQTEWYAQTCTWTCAKYGASCDEATLKREWNLDNAETYRNLKSIVFLKNIPESGHESLTTWCTSIDRRYYDSAQLPPRFPVPAVDAKYQQKCWLYGVQAAGAGRQTTSSRVGGANTCEKHWPAVPEDAKAEGALGNNFQRLCPCTAQCDANFGQVGCRDGKQQWIWYHDECWKTGKCTPHTLANGLPNVASCANWKRPEWGMATADAGQFFNRAWGTF